MVVWMGLEGGMGQETQGKFDIDGMLIFLIMMIVYIDV